MSPTVYFISRFELVISLLGNALKNLPNIRARNGWEHIGTTLSFVKS